MSHPLLRICCRWCDFIFFVCRSCWRGQAYCCDQCRLAGKRHSHRKAQRRYRQSPKGKKAHRQAENRRRHRLSQKIEKNMDDASSTGITCWCIGQLRHAWSRIFHSQKAPRCHFCGSFGRVVDEFARRGYG